MSEEAGPGRVVYLNGAWVPEQEAAVSIFDSSLVWGDAVFETTRARFCMSRSGWTRTWSGWRRRWAPPVCPATTPRTTLPNEPVN